MAHVWRKWNEKGLKGIGCVACVSSNPNTDKAFVFVHGFRGKNPKVKRNRVRGESGTWAGFEHVVDSDDLRFEQTDTFFVTYRSVRADTHLSAVHLLEFLRRQLTVSQARPRGKLRRRNVNDWLGVRSRAKRYKKLTIVAHSEGAVVVRKAIALAAKARAYHEDNSTNPPHAEADALVLDARLRLFAPAQGGHRLTGLLSVAGDVASSAVAGLSVPAGAASAVRALLSPAAYSRAYQDMTPDSLGLSQLHADTGHLVDRQLQAGRARTLWSDNDKVVESVDLWGDLPSHILKGSNHKTVCKPDRSRREKAILAFLFDHQPTGHGLFPSE